MNRIANVKPPTEYTGSVYCPICTHTVEGQVVLLGRYARVKPGQRCPRCGSALEAGTVLRLRAAA